jgi:hypothetical protein
MSNITIHIYNIASYEGSCSHDLAVAVSPDNRAAKITNPHLPPHAERRRALRVAAALQICEACPTLDTCRNFATRKPPMEEATVLGGIYFGNKTKLVNLVRAHNKRHPKNKIRNFTKWTFRPVADYDDSADIACQVIKEEIYKTGREERAIYDADSQRIAKFLRE